MQLTHGFPAIAGVRVRFPGMGIEHALHLHQLETMYLSCDMPEGMGFGGLLGDMEREAKKLVTLVAGGVAHRAAMVRFYTRAEDAFRADDLPEVFNVAPLGGDEGEPPRLQCSPGYAVTSLELCAASGPGSGEVEAVDIDEDGTLHLPGESQDGPFIIFAVVKGARDRLYKKFVWVVG